MTNKPSDGEVVENNTSEVAEKTTSEFIRLVGERTPVDNGGKSVKDDYSDYVFVRPHKSKRKKRGSSHSQHKSYRRKHRKMKLWKKILLSVVCVLLSLILIVVATVAILIHKGKQELHTEDYNILAPEIEDVEIQDDGDYIIYKGKKYELNKNITNILFMGIDKRVAEETDVYGKGGQADFVALGAIDTSTGKTSFININRDTMTDVTLYSEGGSFIGTEEMQLCLSYAYGDGKEKSCENTVDSVERLFYNIPINSYFALDLDGMVAVNDSIGGVDVVSPETIYNFVEGQTYHLEGDLTKAFVKSRDTSVLESNLMRNERQKVYLEAFMKRVVELTKQDLSTPINLYNASAPYSCTNINLSKISYLAESVLLSDGLSMEMVSVPGEVKAGEKFAEFYVDEEKFYDMFLKVFYKEIQ